MRGGRESSYLELPAVKALNRMGQQGRAEVPGPRVNQE